MFSIRKFIPKSIDANGNRVGCVKTIIEVTAILPVKLAMNKNFIKFQAKFDKVVSELQTLKKRSYLKSIVVLELKEVLKTRKLSGKIHIETIPYKRSPPIFRKKYNFINYAASYSESYFSYYSVFNIKHWNAQTKKCNTKGLKTVGVESSYKQKNFGEYQQQTFNQIDAEGLKALAVLNGFKQEKGKKYQYGDYAEFAFKLN